MLRIIIFLLCTTAVQAQQGFIALNQEGFFPMGPKQAAWVGATTSAQFYILRTGARPDTVFRGMSSSPKASKNSSLQVSLLDFSALQMPGNYTIHIGNVPASYPFSISTTALRATAISSLKGFYYQRVSQPLEFVYAGTWARAAGHPDTAVYIHPSAANKYRLAGTVISSPGGWYDAGDYNKYIVNSGITVGTLLSAYEDFKIYFDTLRTHIPESGNKLPDLIDEILINLRWMLTMQDPNDGGVYHKLTNAAFDGMVMPGVTTLPRYAVQKSTAATLDFAAVLAQSARILKNFSTQLPGLSDSCLQAATKAWQWALQHPNILYDQDAMNKTFDPDVSTGAYGDGSVADEKLWAAAELWITTGKNIYAAAIGNSKGKTGLMSWNYVGTMGLLSISRHAKKLSSSAGVDLPAIRTYLLNFADSLVNNIGNNAFGTVMGGSPKDFEWGSNSVAANQGIILIHAYLLTKNKKYLTAALSNADYILGRNATGYCFVTGAGTKSTMRPHHRPSVADGIVEPVPGLLAGGPNPGKQDKCNYTFSEPETTYVDDECSYASNEIAINWNAPLVYLLNALIALASSY
jgi:endoglucanase